MRIFTKSLLALALTIVCVGGAKSQDYQIYERKTSVAAGDVVAIVNETDGTGKAFYGSGGNGLAYDVYTNAFKNTNATICFKLEAVTGGFLLRAMTPEGAEYSVYGGPGYLNSQEAVEGKWCCFIQGLNNQNGQDILNGAVWDIQYSSENGGFSIKNVGTDKYLKDATPAKYDAATYFTLCTILDKEYNLSANHVLNVTNSTSGTNLWDRSATYTLSSPMVAGKTYVIKADVNAVNGGAVQICCKVASGDGKRAEYPGSKGALKNEFTRLSWEFTPPEYSPADLYSQVEFQFGRIAGEIYIDNFSCKEKETDEDLVENGDFEIPNSVDGWAIPSWTGQSIQQTEKDLGEVEEKTTVLYSVGSAGFMTFITGEKIAVNEDEAKVYIAKYEAPSVKLTSVSVVPSWTPVIIEASEGDHVFRTTTADADNCSTNELQLNWSPTVADGTIYALGKIGGKVGFVKVKSGVAVPAGKAYLVITGIEARDFIGFGEEDVTSIESVEQATKVDNQYFNIAGQRVAQPTKGLYIVNGKKVVIK